jgi:hypothetical protein
MINVLSLLYSFNGADPNQQPDLSEIGGFFEKLVGIGIAIFLFVLAICIAIIAIQITGIVRCFINDQPLWGAILIGIFIISLIIGSASSPILGVLLSIPG